MDFIASGSVPGTISKKWTDELGALLKLAAPVSFSLVAGYFMQVVDTMFVGRLGPSAIGGVSIGNAYFGTGMIVGMGILTGLDYLVSHAFGAKRFEDCHRYLVQGVCIATAVGLSLMVVMQLLCGSFVHIGIDLELASQASAYLRVLAFSLWPFLLYAAFRQYLQAQGVVMPALLILLAANLVNVAGNWLFVLGNLGMPRLGVAGAAVSTFVSRSFMLVCIVGYTFYRDRRLRLGLRQIPWRFEKGRALALWKLGLPSGMQMLFEVGVFAGATLLAGRLGAVPLAAHQIVLQLASLTFMMPLGLSSAAAVCVGQAMGSGNRAQAIQVGWLAILVGGIFAVFMGLGMYFFAHPLLHLFTGDFQVRAIGTTLLLIAALFQISDGVQVVGTGVLRGVGNTRVPMLANLAGHWVLGLPIGYVLCFSLGWGVQGLWVGLSVGLTAVAMALAFVWGRKARALRQQ